MSKGDYRGAHRGNSRQVTKALCADIGKQHNCPRDTRTGNFLFLASERDIREWREQRSATPEAKRES